MCAADEPREGLALVVSGPSGVGKTTIVREIRERFGGRFSVSATTRPQSAGEVDGVDYHFLTEERFLRMRETGEFLEHAQVFGRYWYGTPRRPVVESLRRGELVILDIDVQGARQVRSTLPEAMFIFILPPSEDELLRRLRARGREDEAVILRRFQEAVREIETARTSGLYDHLIVNDDLDRAVEETCRIVAKRLEPTGRGAS